MPIPLGMMVGMFALILCSFLLVLLLMITHSIGEGICNALQDRGVHLRPRERIYSDDLPAFQRYQRR